ncbi:MAG: archease [Methanomassiliicoccales archaeon]
MKYKLLDHTADIYIQAFGSSIEEIFENSAYALFDQIADISTVRPTGEERIELEDREKDLLLVDYLNELLYMHDAFRQLYSEFNVSFETGRLVSKVRGEELDRERHVLKMDVKAVTYHMLELNLADGYAKFIIDV